MPDREACPECGAPTTVERHKAHIHHTYALPPGAVLVTEETRLSLLAELAESPLPGARYAHTVVNNWLARITEGQG